MKYEITLTVDNNRYGAYYKCFARKKFIVEASDREQAYTLACFEIKKIKHYKNAIVRPLKNNGSHSYSSYSINCEYIKAESSAVVYLIFAQTESGKECIDEATSLKEAKYLVKEYQMAWASADIYYEKMKEE